MAISAPKLAIASDLFALGDESVRIVHGVILHEAEPWAEHGDAQLGLGAHLRQHFHRASGRGGPGGWWILTEVDVELARHEVYRPDVVGWRRERVPERPRRWPLTTRPDFVCEVLSESNAATDQVDKFRVYAENGVPFYWIADPGRKILTVLSIGERLLPRRTPGQARRDRIGATLRRNSLRVGELFGEDPE